MEKCNCKHNEINPDFTNHVCQNCGGELTFGYAEFLPRPTKKPQDPKLWSIISGPHGKTIVKNIASYSEAQKIKEKLIELEEPEYSIDVVPPTEGYFLSCFSDADGNILSPKQAGNNVPEDFVWIHSFDGTREIGMIDPEDGIKIGLNFINSERYSIEDDSKDYPKLISVCQDYDDAETNDWHMATIKNNWSPGFVIPAQKIIGHFGYLIETSWGVYTDLKGNSVSDQDIEKMVNRN